MVFFSGRIKSDDILDFGVYKKHLSKELKIHARKLVLYVEK